MAHDHILTDRSRIETFLECPQKRHIRYTLNRSSEPGPDLRFGIAIHEALANMLTSGSPITPSDPELPPSYTVTGMGLLHAAQGVIAHLRKEYEILSIELEEEPLPLNHEVRLMTRFDAVLRRNSDGLAFVLNWKTTSDIKRFAYFAEPGLQALLEPIALGIKLGEPVGLILIGLSKGRKERREKGALPYLVNPFSRVYVNDSELARSTAPIRRKEWRRHDVSPDEMPAHLRWLTANNPEAFTSSIAHPVVIIPPRWKQELATAEAIEIEHLAGKGVTFHNWSSCRTVMGECEFFDCCHQGLDPMELFPERVPNHPAEELNK